MIDFEKYYGNLDVKELVAIIESLNDYKPEVIEFCKDRISKMEVSEEILKTFAFDLFKKRFYQYFTEGNYLSDEPINIDSFFLNSKEVKYCFNESKLAYIRYVEDARRNLPS